MYAAPAASDQAMLLSPLRQIRSGGLALANPMPTGAHLPRTRSHDICEGARPDCVSGGLRCALVMASAVAGDAVEGRRPAGVLGRCWPSAGAFAGEFVPAVVGGVEFALRGVGSGVLALSTGDFGEVGAGFVVEAGVRPC